MVPEKVWRILLLRLPMPDILPRRLVDVVQDVVISEEDCGTSKGIEIEALHEGDEVMEPLSSRIVGRVAQEDIYDPVTEEIICPINTLIDEQMAKKIESTGMSGWLFVRFLPVIDAGSLQALLWSKPGYWENGGSR
jgi:DNA-directed RNA polymerase subunit beta'